MRNLLLLCACALSAGGCSAEWPFQWKAGEDLRQAQALVEDNIDAAKPHADELGKVHLAEAAGAARAVTTYVGEPEVRLKPTQPVNAEKIADALQEAHRPSPDATDVLRALPDEAERTVLPWADLAVSVLLALGATGAGAAALRYRNKAKAVLDAFRETVHGIDNGKDLLAETQSDKLLTELAKAQSAPAKELVDKVKSARQG